MVKYKYLVLFHSIKDNKEFKLILSNNFFTYEYLFKSFKNVYIVNINNLRFTQKKANLDIKILKNFFPNLNLKFCTLDKFIHLHKFLKNKKIVGIKDFGTTYSELIINIFLKFYDVRLLLIGNTGHQNYGTSIASSRIKLFKNYLIKILAHKLTIFLSMIGLVRKIDIRFISNPDFIEFNKNHITNKIANFLNLPYAKKLIIINSRAYDIFLKNKFKIKNDYITVLDEELNHQEWTRFSGVKKKKDIMLHYKKFNIYLKKLSKVLKKKVIICIHPNDDLDEKKKLFKNFKVLKYKTREYIYKSYLVVFFGSSAIVDAILLNKNITTIRSKILDKNQISSSLYFVKGINAPISTIDNIENLNLTKDFLIKSKIIKNTKEIKRDYKNFLKKYVCAGTKNTLGVEKIKKMIKLVYKLN
jgi:hypothetical protein